MKHYGDNAFTANTTFEGGVHVNTLGTVVSGYVDMVKGGGWDAIGYSSAGVHLAVGGYRASQFVGVELYGGGAMTARIGSNEAAFYGANVSHYLALRSGYNSNYAYIANDSLNGLGLYSRTSGHAALPVHLPDGGLAFPATQTAHSGANTLDDYEEGTWTPTGAGSTGGTPTYLGQVGEYTKIGHLVVARCYLRLNGLGTMSGNFLIGGLPFAISTSAYVSCSIPYFSGTNINVSQLGGYAGNGGTSFNIVKVSGSGGTGSLALAVSELQTGIEFMMQTTYKV